MEDLPPGGLALALAGIFGAGKTTSMTFMLMWLALTTPPQVRLTVVSKENPAGHFIPAQVAYACARVNEVVVLRSVMEPQNGTPHEWCDITPLTLPPAILPVGQESQGAKVLVVTTGTAFKAVDHWNPEIAVLVGASCIFVHEEGQQAPELLSVSAVAMTWVPCLVIYVGDGNQSP